MWNKPLRSYKPLNQACRSFPHLPTCVGPPHLIPFRIRESSCCEMIVSDSPSALGIVLLPAALRPALGGNKKDGNPLKKALMTKAMPTQLSGMEVYGPAFPGWSIALTVLFPLL